MSRETNTTAPLCPLHIVDTEQMPYLAAVRSVQSKQIAVFFYGTASLALRRARNGIDGIWFVSVELSDLSGPQLIEMLLDFSGHKLVVAMGSNYSSEEETVALSSGASHYFVKPLPDELCWAMVEAFLNAPLAGHDRALRIRNLSV